MSRARGDEEAPSARTWPWPLKPGGYNKDDTSNSPISAPLALGGCTDTGLVKSYFTCLRIC